MVMDWMHEADLRAIERACRAVEKAEADLNAVVSQARADGYSWESIAAPLGTSKQAAWERYRHLDPKKS